jgi:hypothetical protein
MSTAQVSFNPFRSLLSRRIGVVAIQDVWDEFPNGTHDSMRFLTSGMAD